MMVNSTAAKTPGNGPEDGIAGPDVEPVSESGVEPGASAEAPPADTPAPALPEAAAKPARAPEAAAPGAAGRAAEEADEDEVDDDSTMPEFFVDELKPGTRLLNGQYKIVQYLNSGGFGITYLAKDSLDRTVVIKECFPGSFCRRSNSIVRARSRAHHAEFRSVVRLFVQEARNLSKLIHPNIVGVHQVFEDNETAYMAIDYIDGRELYDLIEEPALRPTPDEIVGYLRKLLGAVGFIHDSGVLHRDISPDNILVDRRGEPILIDFGAAREQASKTSRALSALRVVKDGYSPQEFYISGSSQGPSSDLYALAASFYHLIAGEAPPNSQRRLASIADDGGDPYVPLAGRFPGFPTGFLESVDKAASVLPKDRIGSAREWLAMIEGNLRVDEASRDPARVADIETAVSRLVASPADQAAGRRPIISAALNAAPAVQAAPLPATAAPVYGAISMTPVPPARTTAAAERRASGGRGGLLLGLLAVTAAAFVGVYVYLVPGEGGPATPERITAADAAAAVEPAAPTTAAPAVEVAAETPPASPADAAPEAPPATDTASATPAVDVAVATPPAAPPATPPAAPVAESAGEPVVAEAPAAEPMPEPVAEAVAEQVTEPAAEPPVVEAAAAPAAPAVVVSGSVAPSAAPAAASVEATAAPAAPAELRPVGIVAAGWSYTLPFEAEATTQEGAREFPVVTAVAAEPGTVAPDWLAEGVTIYAVNDGWVNDMAGIEAALSSLAGLSTDGEIDARLRIRPAPGAPFQEVALPVRAVRSVELDDGHAFASSPAATGWETVVVAVPEATENGLEVGDVLVAERTSGQTIDAPAALEAVLGALGGAGETEAVFAVSRQGSLSLARMPLVE